MKKLRWILITALVAGIVLLFWRWRSPRSAHESTNTPQPGASVSGDKPQARKLEQMRSLLGAVNHKLIEFYGKVVDQQGAPLADVDVYASVIYNSGLSAGMDKKQTKTDAAGLFSISGMKGRTLGIGLDKDGYEYGGDQGPFQFTEMVAQAERHHPDDKKPVVFRMWKLQGAEALVYFERKTFIISPDEVPVGINLATGKTAPDGGDLTITLRQPVGRPGKWLHNYPWTVRIMAAGLVESSDKLMYLAPESGYVPMLTYGEKGDEKEPRYEISTRLYLVTMDGRYARVHIDMSSRTNPDRPSTVALTWWLNPTPGHRNLEFDPAKAIKPAP